MPTEQDTNKLPVTRPTISKREVEAAKYKEQIRSIERKGRIAAWNDYIGFVISKLVGLGGLMAGGVEALDPNILPFVLPKPEIIAGIGLALLTGKSIITLIAKVEKTLAK